MTPIIIALWERGETIERACSKNMHAPAAAAASAKRGRPTPTIRARHYRRVFRDWPENVCAENAHKYGTKKDAAVPTADKPDF
jgi:hypothetical protein